MTKQEMMSTVYRQLALDYNCQPEDFTRCGILFTEAKMQRGRREMPFVTPRLEVITMGKSTVVNASKSVMPYVKQKFRNKSSYEILTDKLVYGANPYYLPDIEHIKPMENATCSFVLLDKDLHGLYKNKGFPNALQYDRDSVRPEVLAAVAYDQEQIVGRAQTAVFLINTAVFLKSGRCARGIVRLCAGQRDPDIDNRRRVSPDPVYHRAGHAAGCAGAHHQNCHQHHPGKEKARLDRSGRPNGHHGRSV